MPERFSVIVTVRNEERNLPPMLESLVIQEKPFDVVIVDSHSEDRTRDIARSFAERYDFIHLYVYGGTRAAGRNYGVGKSDTSFVAFIDGDCIASPFWLRHLRRGIANADVVAGKTVQIGYRAFEELERVGLYYQGFDITFPSCNLAYRRERFLAIGGFDEWFLTAEDIDLNLRAVESGAAIVHEPEAIVYHRTRGSYFEFLKQAFWNGAGRKQLTLKHGALWSSYRPRALFQQQATFFSSLRLAGALLGYAGYKLFGTPRTEKRL
ncbi:MAG: glycosyltransferase [Euryarchaeota archaeon]|nr:glycosyltransferase [Euryarchaeota archaeon]